MSSGNRIQPPSITSEHGSYHPINQVRDFLIKLLADMGFKEVSGPKLNQKNLILTC